VTFVNEYIPIEDIKKYDIENINKRFIVGGTNSQSWTIDREKNIYLRTVARGREEFSHQSTWTFYWRGELLEVELENISTTGSRGGACSGHKRLRNIEIPQHLETRKAEIISDLKEALAAYKDGGIFATATTYTLTLDI
jgi:hypothetical protein